MTISFFFVRVIFYSVMVFNHIVEFAVLRSYSFWNLYEPWLWKYCYFSIFLYVLMYLLNLFWFGKLLNGTFKALGINSLLEMPEPAY